MPIGPSLIFCSEYAGRKTVLSFPKLRRKKGRRKKEFSFMCTKAFGPRGKEKKKEKKIHTTLQPDKNVSK